jgi:SagB-type dehydrogenase family enzyme
MKPARLALALFTTCLLAAQPAAPLNLPMDLPHPATGGASLNAALVGRKTVRTLSGGPGLTLDEAAQLLWSAQGENRPGRRTVPSAHAGYPLEIDLYTQGSATLPAGFYHYQPAGHKLVKLPDPKIPLGQVNRMQSWIAAAQAVFVVAGVPARLAGADKSNALSLTYYEGGAAAQCLLLQASAMGLEAGTAAGLDMDALAKALQLPADEQILTVLPVGRGR